MFAAMLRNEITWFDADENTSVSFATRLALDSQSVRVVAVVPQEPFLFAASIHENMAIFLVNGEFGSLPSLHFNRMLLSVYGPIFRWYFMGTQTFGGILRRSRSFDATQSIFLLINWHT
jgi:hypothetical protein